MDEQLPLATFRHTWRVTDLMTFAFVLHGRRATTGRRERLLLWMTLPGMFVQTLLGIARQEFYWRPGIALQLEQQGRRRTAREISRPLLVSVGAAGAAGAFVFAMYQGHASLQLGVQLGWVIGLAIGAIVLAVLISLTALGISGRARRRDRRAAGWTHRKSSSTGEVTPPPRRPNWKVSFLAGDPRRARVGALEAAARTVGAVIPAGDVVWTEAADLRLVRLYKRWGFVQWHERSLAMWAVAPTDASDHSGH